MNSFIDTTIDDYFLNPYKFTKTINDENNKNFIIDNSNKNLNSIIKTLTSIIMTNSELENKNKDEFLIFKLVANFENDKLKKIFLSNKTLNINLQDNDGDTALHIAIFLSNYEACNILIKNNANIFIKDKWEQTPLHRICFALENKNVDKIIDLINFKQKEINEKNNIFNCVDKYNNTSLHLVIKYILKNKIIINKNILSFLHKLISLTDINIINDDGLSCGDLINMLNLS